MRAVRIEYKPEHRNKWRRRRLVVFGRSIPIATTALLLATISVAAWAGYLLTQATVTSNIDVAAAPVELALDFTGSTCNIQAGSGSVSSDVLTGRDLVCGFAGFDDTTVAQMSMRITNNEAFTVHVSAVVPADEPCVDWELDSSGEPAEYDITPGANGWWRFRGSGIVGPAGTITCAGTSIGPFVATIDPSVP